MKVIKGHHSKASMTAVAPRRDSVIAVLEDCPVGRWVGVEDLFRLLKASEHPFYVARDSWPLYITEQRYGSFGYDAHYI